MDKKEFRAGRPCTVTYNGTLTNDGWDDEGDVRVKATFLARSNSDATRWHSRMHITLLPDPIEVGDVVIGEGITTGVERAGVVFEIMKSTVSLGDARVIRSTVRIVCRRADRLDLGGE